MTRARTTASSVPIGSITQFAGLTVPSGYLFCTGQSVNRVDYPSLFSAVTETKGTFTVTIATPAVFTLASHALITGSQVYLTTTGALPTGLAANTNYFVVSTGANTFNLATTFANAIAGTVIATSGSQSGVHTLVHAPYGVASSTTFSLPNLTGRTPVGIDTTQTEFNTLGETGGAKTHTLTTAEIPAHPHPASSGGMSANASHGHGFRTDSAPGSGGWDGVSSAVRSAYYSYTREDGVVTSTNTDHTHAITVNNNTGGGGAHNNLQPYIVMNYLIRIL